jgi:hypothetical protein
MWVPRFQLAEEHPATRKVGLAPVREQEDLLAEPEHRDRIHRVNQISDPASGSRTTTRIRSAGLRCT